MASKLTMTPGEILREGELEKRSDSLFQLWKKKRGVLTDDSLRLFSGTSERAKELRFHSILKVDCVEHTRKYVYFTIVTTDFKEIDFRCTGESCWNASITLALIDYQNRRAVEGFRRHRFQRAASEAEEEPESPEQRALSPWTAPDSVFSPQRRTGPVEPGTNPRGRVKQDPRSPADAPGDAAALRPRFSRAC
ncbi:pleckstrin homology-like domain family A member 2-like protein [Cricetulus griseus]|nr:pleckstrin homology-like domain family A member 2-like protein [Cricetulus griseus]